MKRIRTFLRQQSRAWTMLVAPTPKPFVWPEPVVGEHPSALCRCIGSPVTHGEAAYVVDHLSGCLWLAAMCRTCRGTGACSTCQGDGIQPEGSTSDRVLDLQQAGRDLVEILGENFDADDLAADPRYVAARSTLEIL